MLPRQSAFWAHLDVRLMRSTLTAQLEEALRADIIQGVLAPGRRLRSAEMAQHYGVSATPLREALQSLAAQSLVTIDPRFGATVAETSLAELRDIFWLRDILESVGIERSLALGDAAWERTGVSPEWWNLSKAPDAG